MRVDSLKLPQAALQHSRVHGTDKPFPGVPSEKANENAGSKRPASENIAASTVSNTTETATGNTSEKLTPSGLMAAQLRFQGIAEADRTQGQSRALEVITRNLARYQTAAGTQETPSETTPVISPTSPETISTGVAEESSEQTPSV